MQTTSETDALFADLLSRASIVVELDGPQLEGWVSGLFSALDDGDTIIGFLDHCQAARTAVGATLAYAIAELSRGLDDGVSSHAESVVDHDLLTEAAAHVGESALSDAWEVEAPFGRSIVLGFEAPVLAAKADEIETEPTDPRHAILVEIHADGRLEDLQLAGSPDELIAEAAESGEAISATRIDVEDAVARVVASWPTEPLLAAEVGPGVAANQQFVRRRVLVAARHVLPAIAVVDPEIDVRRGMDDDDFAAANRAALSTLRSAVGDPAPRPAGGPASPERAAWSGVIRGDGGELSGRERDALLWLEWADWLGVGIGLLRSGAGTEASGQAWVDLVNRCPEVSSTIDKADREYAAWAFDVAIDLLADSGVIDEAGEVTEAGHAELHAAMLATWGNQ